jgi:virulence factor Mce-like protein
MSQPNPTRAISFAAVLAGAIAVLVIVLQSGSSYRLRLILSDADGLRPQSEVQLGGVQVGSVSSIDLGPNDQVVATLHLDPKKVTIGTGASASIEAANLLGEKFVELAAGDQSDPLPSGTTLPPSRTTVEPDLDQVLDVLDADTSERLAILINEAGQAVTGRQADFSALLRQLPLSVGAATSLLTQLVRDNHTLGDTVAASSQFIARLDTQKLDLGHLIDAASGAATTTALRSDDLHEALTNAPSAMSTLQSFLADLRSATVPLRPAAVEIAASAQPLSGLLSQVRPFERAAVPTLNEAASVSPLLTELGEHATPTVTAAVPTVQSLSTLSSSAAPLTHWAGLSVDDLMAVMENWDRAIQGRDAMGHVFHANIGVDPTLLTETVPTPSTSSAPKAAASSPGVAPVSSPHPPSSGTTTVKQPSASVPGSVASVIAPITSVVNSVVNSVVAPATQPATSALSSLLKYLFGP